MDENTRNALPQKRRGLRDLRLRNRLVLLVLLPLTAGVALGTARIVNENQAITAESNLAGQVQVALEISKLVHSVQDERDLIARYLTQGQSQQDMSALSAAERETGAQVQAFEAARQQYAGSLSALAQSAQTLALQADARLGDLTVLRASVVSLGDSRPVFQAYTTIVGTLLNFSGQLATGTTDHALGNLVNTLTLVEQAGEQTSQERGYLVAILGGGQTRVQQEALIQAQAQYASALNSLTAQAPPSLVNLYQSTVGGQDTGTADSLVQQVVDATLDARPASTTGEEPAGAYTAATTKLTQVRQVEDQVGAQALDRTSVLESNARTQLYVNAGIVILTLLLAFGATTLIARSIVEPLKVLRTSAYEIATVGLPGVIRRLRDTTDADVASAVKVEPIPVLSRDEIGEVARAFDEVHDSAVRLATEQALLRGNVNAMFKNLSRRSQVLVERQLLLIDGLENGEKDAGQLAQLFKLDHLATRMRRNNENLLVLAGEETARRWTEAVRLVDVARAAAAEVEQYERIMFGEIPRTRIVGKAAPDVAHLVAELLENATTYSSPQTKVWVAARPADDGGVLLHIEDVGIGMTAADLQRANEQLTKPPLVSIGVSRQMGLFVVGRLAARYGIRVTLSESPAGGVTASIQLPASLIDLGAMTSQRPADPDAQWGLAADSAANGFGATRRLGAPPSPPSPGGAADGARFRDQPGYAGGDSGANPVLPGQFGLPPFPESATAEPPGWNSPAPTARNAVPQNAVSQNTVSQNTAPQNHVPQNAATQNPATQNPLTRRQDPAWPTAAPFADAAPAAPVPDPVWFEPKQAMRDPAELGERPNAAQAQDSERLPIFEAVESEWFRRRGTRPPHSGWSPRSVQPWDATRAATAAQATAAGVPQPRSANPPRVEPAPAPPSSEPEPPRVWNSPGDDAWKAAAALAQPVHGAETPGGLPRRVPKANLVPGKAGGDGAAKATPPAGIPTTADAVRQRLSTFRRNSQRLAGDAEQS